MILPETYQSRATDAASIPTLDLTAFDSAPLFATCSPPMRSIDALPREIWLSIASLLTREDLLKFRLVSPRQLLPEVNSIVFENLVINVDGSDDLTRWYDAERDGVAIQRLNDVAKSRIADHVRTLTLRVTRPYSLSAFYEERFGEINHPVRNYAQSTTRTISKRISGIFRKGPAKQRFQPSTRRGVDYDKELANGLRNLFKATDLVKLVRIKPADGYVSEYDIVYPSVYGRVLVRTFKALRDVKISANATFEILDCPITHIEESGQSLDQQLVSDVLHKFTTFGFSYRKMAYAVIKRDASSGVLGGGYQRNHYRTQDRLDPKGLGMQLLKAFSVSFSHLEGLMLRGIEDGPHFADLLLSSKAEKPNFRCLKLAHIQVSKETLTSYINPCLHQMQTIVFGRMKMVGEDSHHKIALLDEWIALRQKEGSREWHLETLAFNDFYWTYTNSPSDEIRRRIERLTIRPKTKKKATSPVRGFLGDDSQFAI